MQVQDAFLTKRGNKNFSGVQLHGFLITHTKNYLDVAICLNLSKSILPVSSYGCVHTV